jgi:hypothetical protein
MNTCPICRYASAPLLRFTYKGRYEANSIFNFFTLVMTSEANAGAFDRAIAVGSGHTFGKYFTLGGAIAFAVAVMVLGGIIGYIIDHYNDY